MEEHMKAALERELAGYEHRGLKERAAQVRAVLAGKIETATEPTGETTEAPRKRAR